MFGKKVRKVGASLLVLSVWFGALALVPRTFAQATNDSPVAPASDKKAKDSPKVAATPAAKQGALNPKDDPSQIGKRNINTGTDKFFGWLGGSQAKEMQIGRQLAMEVEQQAKMVDDPVVTEYVNRVGQNIVLHSDAKVPFTIKVIDSDEVNAFALPAASSLLTKASFWPPIMKPNWRALWPTKLPTSRHGMRWKIRARVHFSSTECWRAYFLAAGLPERFFKIPRA